MNESSYTRSINKKLPPEIDWWKISDRYKSGVPDCNYSTARDLWVEYKFDPKAPKIIRLSTRVTKLQDAWLTKRHLRGHNVAVVYGTQTEGAMILRYPDWQRDVLKEEFLACCINKDQLIDWITGELL